MKKTVIILTLGLMSIISQGQKKSTPGSDTVSGKRVYVGHCMTCHQVDGSGAQNMIPPLIKTNFVLGAKATLIKIVLNGLNGEIKVNGDIYAGEMPAQDTLTNSEIAAVLTYVRSSFGNKASRVTITEVEKIRVVKKKGVAPAKTK